MRRRGFPTAPNHNPNAAKSQTNTLGAAANRSHLPLFTPRHRANHAHLQQECRNQQDDNIRYDDPNIGFELLGQYIHEEIEEHRRRIPTGPAQDPLPARSQTREQTLKRFFYGKLSSASQQHRCPEPQRVASPSLRRLQRGAESRRLRQVQQSAWARAQLHRRGHGRRPRRPGNRNGLQPGRAGCVRANKSPRSIRLT